MSSLPLLVKDQFPGFVQADYPAFIEFVQTYYKWMSSLNPDTIQNLLSLDKTPEAFVEHFRKQYDVYGITRAASPSNLRYLTNIKEFYTTKGSEQGLVTALRMLSNIEASIEYPSQSILRPSDGRWSQEAFVLFTAAVGELPDSVDRILVAIDQTEVPIELTNYEIMTDTTARLYFKKSALFAAEVNQVITIRDTAGVAVCAGYITPTMSTISIVDGGEGWQLGRVIVVPADSNGRNTIVRVAKTDAAGTVERLDVVEYGSPHTDQSTFTTYPVSTNPTEESALTIRLNFGTSVTLLGKWLDESGQISNEAIRVQDSYYYQQFSYVIAADQPLSEFYDTAAAFHIAGAKSFAVYNLSTNIVTTIEGSTEFPFLEFQFGPDVFALSDEFMPIRSLLDNVGVFDQLVANSDTTEKISVASTLDVVYNSFAKTLADTPLVTEDLLTEVSINKASATSMQDLVAKSAAKYLSGPGQSTTFFTVSDGDAVYFPPVEYAAEDYFAEPYTVPSSILRIGA